MRTNASSAKVSSSQVRPTRSTRVRSLAPAAAWLLGSILLLPASSYAQGGEELEGKIVKRIDFHGLSRYTKASVMARMQTQEGRIFRREALEDDVRTLAGQVRHGAEPRREGPGAPGPEVVRPPAPKIFGVIPSVRAELDRTDGTVVITINGEENRSVAGLVFLGIVDFGRDELLQVIKTRAGNPVDDFILEVDRKELLLFYQEKGYHYCDVRWSKTTEATGDLIIFRITEGPEVSIRRVEFRGAQAFDQDDLLSEMPFTDEPGFLSSQEFVLDQVKRDAVQLRLFYYGRGYLDAQVTLLEWIPTPDHEDVDLVFLVEEGELYRVRSIAIEGLTLLDPEEVLREFRTRVGDAYETNRNLRLDIRDLEAQLNDRGYTEADIRDTSTFGLEENDVDIRIQVTEGALIRVGEIIIEGIVETQDRIVRRELEIYTGEPLNLRKLNQARARIRNLGYWTQPRGVLVETPEIPVQSYEIYRDAYIALRDTERGNIKDIKITVEEADTGSLRFAAGVGSNAGIVGDITYTKTNFDPFDWPDSFGDTLDAFTGGGQILVLSVQPGTVFSRWRVAWTNPRVFDSPWSVGGEIYQTFWRRENWDEERLGYALRIGRRLGEDFSANLSLRDELVDVNDIDDDAPQLVFDFEGENRVTTLTLDMRLSRLNDFLNPTDGYLLQGSLEHGGLWGDIQFNKAIVRGDYYFEVYEDDDERLHVMRLRGQAGWASEFGDTRDLPVYERFYAGGAGSLRGFKFRGVGPMDNDDPIGGKAIWTAGAEYQFPLYGELFRGVAFVDTGSVALDWSDESIFDARVSVGVGLRIIIPFLSRDRPLAIDFGIPLVDFGEDETQIISFSFGSR